MSEAEAKVVIWPNDDTFDLVNIKHFGFLQSDWIEAAQACAKEFGAEAANRWLADKVILNCPDIMRERPTQEQVVRAIVRDELNAFGRRQMEIMKAGTARIEARIKEDMVRNFGNYQASFKHNFGS